MIRRLIAPLILSLALYAAVLPLVYVSGCAHGLAVKQQAVAALSAGEVALKQARVSELALFNAPTPGYTAAQHLKFLDGLEAAQRAEISTAHALQVWTPGQAAPADAAGYVAAGQAVVDVIKALNIPAAADALAKAQAVLDNATAVAKMLSAGK